MTASIHEKSGKYYVVLSWQTADSKRKQKWIGTDIPTTGNNKRKAEKRRVEILNEWENKVSANGTEILFSDYLKTWLEDTKSTISENTYFSYRTTIHNSICSYFESKKIKLCDLKPYHLQEFYNIKMARDGVTANTVHHYHANIHKALDFALNTERINSNSADKVTLPKKEKHIADCYTADELKTLLREAKGSSLETVILLAAWFGLRRGEIVGLKWDCVDFKNNTIAIVGTVTDKGENGSKIKNLTYRPTTKTKASLRTFPMTKEAAEYLNALKSAQEHRRLTQRNYNNEFADFVCVRNNGDLMPLEYISRAFPRFCEQCGLRRIPLHSLRHTNISLLVQSGANMKEVQEWAGHSSYSTTADIYSHIQAKSKIKLLESLEKLFC